METKEQFIDKFNYQQKIRYDITHSSKTTPTSQKFITLLKKLIYNKDKAYAYEIKHINNGDNNDNYNSMTNACKEIMVWLRNISNVLKSDKMKNIWQNNICENVLNDDIINNGFLVFDRMCMSKFHGSIFVGDKCMNDEIQNNIKLLDYQGKNDFSSHRWDCRIINDCLDAFDESYVMSSKCMYDSLDDIVYAARPNDHIIEPKFLNDNMFIK